MSFLDDAMVGWCGDDFVRSVLPIPSVQNDWAEANGFAGNWLDAVAKLREDEMAEVQVHCDAVAQVDIRPGAVNVKGRCGAAIDRLRLHQAGQWSRRPMKRKGQGHDKSSIAGRGRKNGGAPCAEPETHTV